MIFPVLSGNAKFAAMKKKKDKPKMLTVGQVAKRINAGVSSVRLWAKQGKFHKAEKVETPAGSYWLIPESSLHGFEKQDTGRPLGKKSKKKKK
jgi:hypothetical protein